MLGEVAAVVTSAAWAGCARFFGAAGLRIGSVAVNHLRLVGGVLLLTLLHLLLLGIPAPAHLSPGVVLLFAASGIVGLSLGDACLFRAWVLVGPLVGTLVMTTVPAWGALLAFLFLGERLGVQAVAAIAVTVTGVVLAVSGGGGRPFVGGRAATRAETALGLALASLGALGQAGGIVLAKPALAHAPALSGTWIRMACAAVFLWTVTLASAAIRRRRPAWWAVAARDRRALLSTLGGTLCGPALGVWLSLIAVQHAPVAVAVTLMSLTPLFVVLLDWAVDGRRPRRLEVLGAAVAVAGVGLLVAS